MTRLRVIWWILRGRGVMYRCLIRGGIDLTEHNARDRPCLVVECDVGLASPTPIIDFPYCTGKPAMLPSNPPKFEVGENKPA